MTARRLARRLLPHSAYRLYRRGKIARQVAAYRARDVTHTYGGVGLTLRLADPLAEGWYDHDWEEPSELRFLRERGVLAEGATVFEIGAHQGVVALMLGDAVGPRGRVVAVEAEPHNARIATINRDRNGAANVTVVHAAGASAAGWLMFAEGLNGHVERTRPGNVGVRAATVDDLAVEFGNPDLLYVDVEGFEGEVLDGASGVLASGRTSVFVEVHEQLRDYGGTPEGVIARLAGFQLYWAPSQDAQFVPLAGGALSGRCFLIALAPAHRPTVAAGQPAQARDATMSS